MFNRLYCNFLLALGVFISASNYASAACSYLGGLGFRTENYKFGNVIVQRDSPVGTVLGSKSGGIWGSPFVTCSTSFSLTYELTKFSTPTSLAGVYATNIDGVGIKIFHGSKLFPFTSGTYRANTGLHVSGPTVSLVKITSGEIKAGSITTGSIAKVSIQNEMQIGDIILRSANIIPLACSIKTPSLTFPIGDIAIDKFGSSVGTIPSGAQNTQNLGLECNAQANINVELNGIQNPDVSNSSVLALTGQGSNDVASGVGVQILYNGAPLKLNNSMVLKKSIGGQETFPLTARYYQTKTAVTTGTANSSATLNITYQ